MKKTVRTVGLVLLGILVLGTFVFLYQKSRPKTTTYNIETVDVGNIEKRSVATGKVEPRNEILIKPQMSGIIAEIYKEAGQKVEAGDVIAKIQVIPDMVNLSGAESRVNRAKLQAEQSRANYERDKQLYEKSVISKEEFDKVVLQFRNDQEELAAANDNLSLVRTGITKSSAKTSNTLVRATVSGTILDIPVKVGNSVIQSNNFNDGTTVASVANLNDMLFVGKVDETEVGKLHEGMAMDITIGALQGEKMNATLEYISPKASDGEGAILFEMKAAMQMPSDVYVRAGYSANAEIVLEKREAVTLVPESSVEFENDSAYVYVLTKENPQTFERKAIKTGLSDGIRIEITEGLKKGERIRGAEITDNK